jgi:hypothetical protein
LSGPLAGIRIIELEDPDRGAVCVDDAGRVRRWITGMGATADAQMAQAIANDAEPHVALQQNSQNSPC